MKSHYTPDPKKTTKRRKASRDTWALLRERLQRVYGKCQVCKTKPGSESHHLLPRSQSGSDEFANLAWLCQDCHHNVTEWKDDARTKLRINMTRIQTGYLFDTAGAAWTDDNYPLGGADAAGSAERANSYPSELESRSKGQALVIPAAGPDPAQRAADIETLWGYLKVCGDILRLLDAPVRPVNHGWRYDVVQMSLAKFIADHEELLKEGRAA